MRDLTEVRRALEFDPNSQILRRTEALLLQQLGDRYGAIESFERAASCGVADPCSNLRLAEILRDDQRLEEAIEQTKPLIDAGLLSNPDASARNRIRLLRAHWVSVLWLKRYAEVLTATGGWRVNTELRPAYVALRVSALQRYIDDGTAESSRIDDSISEMLTCLSEAFRIDGYLADVVHEGFHALERLQRILERGRLSLKSVLECSRFLDAHLPGMCGTSNEYSLSDVMVVRLVKNLRAVRPEAGNPLNSPRWTDLILVGKVEDRPLTDAGYESARVSNVACAPLGYVFARSLDGTRDFFVRQSATELNAPQFNLLKYGQLLEILPDDQTPERGRAWPAKHAMLS